MKKEKLSKLLLIVSIVSLGLLTVFLIGSFILALLKRSDLAKTFLITGSIFGVVSFASLIVRAVYFGFDEVKEPEEKIIITVDVKEAPQESKEEKLYKQYEDLYKQKLITKEDLEKKRVELLGK